MFTEPASNVSVPLDVVILTLSKVADNVLPPELVELTCADKEPTEPELTQVLPFRFVKTTMPHLAAAANELNTGSRIKPLVEVIKALTAFVKFA